MHSGKPTQFAFELKLLFFYFFVFLALSRKSVATCLFKLPFEWNATRITFAIPKCKFTTVYTFNRLNFIMARENYLVYNCFQCKWLFSFFLFFEFLENKSGQIFCFRQVYSTKSCQQLWVRVNQHFILFIHHTWGETVMWGAVFYHTDLRKNAVCISQFFKANCTHSIFRTVRSTRALLAKPFKKFSKSPKQPAGILSILSTPASDVYGRLKTNGKAIKIATDYYQSIKEM